MEVQSLNGVWQLTKPSDGEFCIDAAVPGSVYTAMLDSGLMSDPYIGENQYEAERISEDDYTFVTEFRADESITSSERIILHFDGIDTLAEVVFNGSVLGFCDNMHRTWEFDVTELMEEDIQRLEVRFASPVKYIREKNAERPLWGVASTMTGYTHIRKAHYMFGWDWGPVLPDMGIWRGVSLYGINGGRIESFYQRQRFFDNAAVLEIEANIAELSVNGAYAEAEILTPDGHIIISKAAADKRTGKAVIMAEIPEPKLWYPRGYGAQPLYKLKLSLKHGDETLDSRTAEIGLRKIEICRTPDNDGTDGEEFAFAVNGVKIFAMGANYIPEDQLITRTSREKTEKLLSDCISAGYNMIRVWGGGVYPEEYFYDFCDRNGLLVWQDCMFACSVYSADRPFCESVKHEIIDNAKRLRNHASLAMWCGNNEIESAWQYWGLPKDNELKKGYLRMFEVLIPKVLKFYDPETFYWPSSPSSGGSFKDSGAMNKGDIHYWEVWHSCKPFTEYNKYLFRFCSEYGFESIPSIKTVRSFAEEKDMNLMSPVMEAHQKCEAGNEKLMYYIAQMMNYPYTFEGLVYASQLVQADAIRLNVEHMRRNRGVCMGSLYWQVNDSNPVISWSSIDYFGRWKALHYYARKFYAPVLLSVDLSDKDSIIFNVSSERQSVFTGIISWRLRSSTGEIISSGDAPAGTAPLSADNCLILDRKDVLPRDDSAAKLSLRRCCLEAVLIENGARISSVSALFVQPKSFEFADPKLRFETDDIGDKFRITVHSSAYAKGVCLELKNYDCVFSDNWFDLYGNDGVVFVNKSALPEGMTSEMLSEELTVTSYYTAVLHPDEK